MILQRYRMAGLADAKVFRLDGLTWRLGDKTRTETNLRDWAGERAQAGRLPPNGFPRSGRLGDEVRAPPENRAFAPKLKRWVPSAGAADQRRGASGGVAGRSPEP